MGNRSTNTERGLNVKIDGRLLSYARNTFFRGGGGTNFVQLGVVGGNVNDLRPGNGYAYHTFTSPGTLQINGAPKSVEILIVGGGGGGGADDGGGGGAGGLISTSRTVPVGAYVVEVGAGGTGGTSISPTRSAVNGTPSSIVGIVTVSGGGRGGGSETFGNQQGAPGGSGGGGCGGGSEQIGGSANNAFPGQLGSNGSYGGPPVGPQYSGGGGGGAGGGGTGGTNGGAGAQYPGFTGTLIGVPALSPLNGFFAGGGGGANRDTTSSGGSGGGGAGSHPGAYGPGISGTTNSGGGGGGSADGSTTSGNGGSGIVIVRYLLPA